VEDVRAAAGPPGAPERMTDLQAPDAIPITRRSFDELLDEAVRFHGHLCPGQVLGVRMVVAGCRELGLPRPRQAGKRLVVFVEIDRCAADAIEVLTGVSFGKGTFRHLDYGKLAATFADVAEGRALRVTVRDEARSLAPLWAPGQADPRAIQTAAYRVMPETDLLRLQWVTVDPAYLERRRERVLCEACHEGVTYRRVVRVGGRTLCRSCAGDGYYRQA
jgi:formylmethanofuran dehydrogenase subunit E